MKTRAFTLIIFALLSIAAYGQVEVQHTTCEATSGTTMSCTFSSNVTAGNLIVWMIQGQSFPCLGTGNTFNDSLGNSFTILTQRSNSTGTTSSTCILYISNCCTGSDTLTWIHPTPVDNVGYAVEFSGMTSIVADTTAFTTPGSGVTSASVGPLAPTRSPSLFLCAAANVNSTLWSAATSPVGNTFTQVAESNGHTTGANLYQFMNSTSANTCTFTIPSTSLRTVIAAGYLLYTPSVAHHRRPSQVY